MKNPPFNGGFFTFANLWIPTVSYNRELRFLQLDHCVIEPDARAFVDELYDRFCKFYPAISIKETWIGTKILDACKQLGFHGVHRDIKRRKDEKANPQANLVGIALKEEK